MPRDWLSKEWWGFPSKEEWLRWGLASVLCAIDILIVIPSGATVIQSQAVGIIVFWIGTIIVLLIGALLIVYPYLELPPY